MVPTFEDFLYPFLLTLKDGELSHKEVKEKLIEHFNISEADAALTTRSGRTTQVSDRIGWCRQYFRRAKFIEIPRKGIWKITDRGLDYLNNHTSLTISDLLQYAEFAEFARRTHTTTSTTSSTTCLFLILVYSF